jgi:AcrR family transcriptional regulator
MDQEAAVARIFDGLLRGELTREDLSARRISALLGHSTMVLYHHFASLDGFLIRVDGRAWRAMGEALLAVRDAGGELADIAERYVRFALDHPHLYWLMAERAFDRIELGKMRRLSLEQPLWAGFVELVRVAGSAEPERDTRLLMAGLHGLSSLALSGRGAIAVDADPHDAHHAIHLARTLADVLLARPSTPKRALRVRRMTPRS